MKKIFFFIAFIFSIQAFGQIEYDRTPKQYFMVELTPTANASMSKQERMEIQRAHMQNIGQLASEKKLVLAGPFPEGGGILFLSVETVEEAEKLVLADPTVSNGLNTYKIRPFVTERGLFTLEQSE